MQRKKDHTKPPFSKCVQVRKTRPNFFLLNFFFVVHTNKHVEQPQKIPRGAPLPFFSFYFPFSFGSELAGGRADGRVPFLGFTGPVRGTTRGREPRPGSSTGAIAHTPPGAETRTVEALPGDGERPPGRPPARGRGEGEGEGRDEGRWSMHVLQQVHLLLQEEAQLLRLSSVFVLCCLVWFGLFSFVAGIVSRYW